MTATTIRPDTVRHNGTDAIRPFQAYLLNFGLALQQEVAGSGGRVYAVLPGATRTPIWERSGTSLSALPEEALMDVDEMVDAALAGMDLGEPVTIPSLPDIQEWDDLTAGRLSLRPRLSLSHAAGRYGPMTQRLRS